MAFKGALSSFVVKRKFCTRFKNFRSRKVNPPKKGKKKNLILGDEIYLGLQIPVHDALEMAERDHIKDLDDDGLGIFL